MLFLGASMCITAFPMLARIIHFKKLTGTTMGTVALGAGAIDDATAWCLLAVVLASFEKNWSHALVNIAGGVAYVALTLLIVRPLLLRAKVWLVKNGTLTEAGLVIGLALMALGAWFTDLIGLHAVFGAFVMGAAMPRGVVARDLDRPYSAAYGRVAASALFHLLGFEYKDRLAQHKLPLGYVRRGVDRGCCGQRRRLLGSRPRDWHSESRSARHRHTNECPRLNGTDHY